MISTVNTYLPIDMEIDELKKCFTKRLDGRYSWSLAVWHGKGFFADYTVHGRGLFDTKRLANQDMNRVIKLMDLTVAEKPV